LQSLTVHLEELVEQRTQELQASELLYRVVLSSIADAIFITNDQGDFTFVCPGVDAIFGYHYDEIKQMVKDAEENAEEDKKRKELVEAKNHAESLVNSTEQNLKEHGDKISAEDKGAIEAAVQSLKDALAGEDLEAIQSRNQALMQVAMKMGEAIYKSQDAQGSEAGPTGSSSSDEHVMEGEVIDAEFEDIDDKKKNG
jgi:molecular chaperone DnaK